MIIINLNSLASQQFNTILEAAASIIIKHILKCQMHDIFSLYFHDILEFRSQTSDNPSIYQYSHQQLVFFGILNQMFKPFNYQTDHFNAKQFVLDPTDSFGHGCKNIHSYTLTNKHIQFLLIKQMRSTISLAILLSVLVCSSVCSLHLLSKFDNEFKQMLHSRNTGATSKSFSIAMKLLVAVEALKGDLDIQDAPALTVEDIHASKTCTQLLNQVVVGGNQVGWISRWEEIYGALKALSMKCTNMDFEQGALVDAQQQSGLGGGFENKCALCVVLTKIMENYIVYHKKNVTDFIENEFCTLFDGIIKPTCEAFVHYAGPFLIKTLLKRENPDRVCLAAGYCKNPDCKISTKYIEDKNIPMMFEGKPKPAPWQWLVHIFVDKFGDGHLPPFDLDNDTFSDISTFRGYNWRATDCDEMNRWVYPGRKTGSKIIDNDCNGVFGVNAKTGKTYEHDFCSNSTRLGLAVIGDSAGAHFSIPQKFFNVTMMHKGTFSDLLLRVANELDIPHESAYTGNTNTKNKGYTRHSIYKYLRDWNLCNSNDYQNVAVNGGDSGNTWGNIKALKRDQKNDYPLLMFMELIGNDVCSKSFDGMTKPAEFKANILKLLNYLDTVVPSGSHLFVLGLADGEVLFDNLHDTIHPLEVTYETVYNFLNCLKISPCWGWLNSNATVRRFTTERAKNLTKMYQQIIDDGTKFKNFDMVYYEFPTIEILQRKIMEGGDPKELIERCDGFHPNGEFHSYLADWIWFKIQNEHPTWIGEKNKHNDQIRKVFGSPFIY